MPRLSQESLLLLSLRRAALRSVGRVVATNGMEIPRTVSEEIGFALEAAADDSSVVAGTAAIGSPEPELGAYYGNSTGGIDRLYEAGEITELERKARIKATRTPAVEAVALAMNAEEFVRESRKRVRRVFTFHLSATIALAVLLIAAIAAAFGFFILGDTRSALAFGGISLAELVGTLVYQPLSRCQAALVASQTLELLIFQTWEQVQACKQHGELKDRIRCMNKTWTTLHATLRSMPV